MFGKIPSAQHFTDGATLEALGMNAS